MKLSSLLIVEIALIIFSCKKPPGTADPTRKIQYVLFTNKDFSGNTDMITFSLIMKNKAKTLFDSSLAPMRIEDIPDSANRIIIEETVPGNDTSTLTVGFLYSIEAVGNSWYLDTCTAKETFKVVTYSFQ